MRQALNSVFTFRRQQVAENNNDHLGVICIFCILLTCENWLNTEKEYEIDVGERWTGSLSFVMNDHIPIGLIENGIQINILTSTSTYVLIGTYVHETYVCISVCTIHYITHRRIFKMKRVQENLICLILLCGCCNCLIN